MALALALAKRGLGTVAPNPAVGCVIVKDGRIVGRGWTRRGGRPHAETEALRRAGAAARGATAYVSLEPCAHHGETPPCADALVAAGIARAVVAATDPDHRVNGRGIGRLEDAGIDVATGLLAAEAEDVNAGFFLRVREGRPLVTLKLATSLDGRIATHTGESRWITGEAARRFAHLLRAKHDAILVGARTVAADDPELTCRLPGLEARSPVRIVVDGHLSLPLTAKLVATAQTVPTVVITLSNAPVERRRALEDLGLALIDAEPDSSGYIDMGDMLRKLGAHGITRVLCEGGAHVAAALLRAGLVDRLAWFRAPIVIGGDGIPAAEAFGVDALTMARAFRRTGSRALGPDAMDAYVRAS